MSLQNHQKWHKAVKPGQYYTFLQYSIWFYWVDSTFSFRFDAIIVVLFISSIILSFIHIFFMIVLFYLFFFVEIIIIFYLIWVLWNHFNWMWSRHCIFSCQKGSLTNNARQNTILITEKMFHFAKEKQQLISVYYLAISNIFLLLCQPSNISVIFQLVFCGFSCILWPIEPINIKRKMLIYSTLSFESWNLLFLLILFKLPMWYDNREHKPYWKWSLKVN